jgi:hypothetical protein
VPPSLNECECGASRAHLYVTAILYMVGGCQSKRTNTPKTTPQRRRQQDARWHARRLIVRVSWSYGRNPSRIITLQSHGQWGPSARVAVRGAGSLLWRASGRQCRRCASTWFIYQREG